MIVEREEEQKQEESSRRQNAEPRQRSDNRQQLSPARQIAGLILIPVVVAGLPVIIVGAAVGAAKEAFAMPFTELMAQAGIDPGTREVRERRAEIERERERAASSATFIAPCVEVLRAEREFGPEDGRMIGPLAAFGHAYVRIGAFNHADLVYRRAASIAEKSRDPKATHQLIEMLIRSGDTQAGAGMSQLADDTYRWAVAIAEQNNVDTVEFERWVEKSYGLRVHVHRNPSRFSWRYGCPSLTNGPKAKHGEQTIHPSGAPYICDDGIWRLAP